MARKKISKKVASKKKVVRKSVSPETWVFLRGLLREERHWEGFPQVFQKRLKNTRAVTINIPGNGSRNQEKSPTSIAGMVEAIRASLQEQGLTAPYNIFSISMGGMIALEWIRLYPDEIRRGVLTNTSVSTFSPFYKRLRARNYPRILRDIAFSKSSQLKEKAILDLTLSFPELREDILEKWTEYRNSLPVSTPNMFRQLWAGARFKAAREAPKMPILLLTGLKDNLVNPECSFHIYDHWPVDWALHKTAGHDLPMDDPDWILKEVKSWLG